MLTLVSSYRAIALRKPPRVSGPCGKNRCAASASVISSSSAHTAGSGRSPIRAREGRGAILCLPRQVRRSPATAGSKPRTRRRAGTSRSADVTAAKGLPLTTHLRDLTMANIADHEQVSMLLTADPIVAAVMDLQLETRPTVAAIAADPATPCRDPEGGKTSRAAAPFITGEVGVIAREAGRERSFVWVERALGLCGFLEGSARRRTGCHWLGTPRERTRQKSAPSGRALLAGGGACRDHPPVQAPIGFGRIEAVEVRYKLSSAPLSGSLRIVS